MTEGATRFIEQNGLVRVGTERQLQLAPFWCAAGQRVIYFRFITVTAGQAEQAVVGETDAGAGG